MSIVNVGSNIDLAYYCVHYTDTQSKSCPLPRPPSLAHDCYYFTNNKDMYKRLIDSNSHWIAVLVDPDIQYNEFTATLRSKLYKSSPHKIPQLQKYQYTCYFDTNVDIIDDSIIKNLMNEELIKNGKAIVMMSHSGIQDLWKEFHVSMEQWRYRREKDAYLKYIQKQIDDGLKDVYSDLPHLCTGFGLRNMRHPQINALNDTFWEHINQCGLECQIAFYFVKQLFADDIAICSFDDTIVRRKC